MTGNDIRDMYHQLRAAAFRRAIRRQVEKETPRIEAEVSESLGTNPPETAPVPQRRSKPRSDRERVVVVTADSALMS